MAERRPLVLVDGAPCELPVGDTVAGAGGGSGAIAGIFYPSAALLDADTTLAAGQNYMLAGPLEIDDGVTLTVEDGVTVTIV